MNPGRLANQSREAGNERSVPPCSRALRVRVLQSETVGKSARERERRSDRDDASVRPRRPVGRHALHEVCLARSRSALVHKMRRDFPRPQRAAVGRERDLPRTGLVVGRMGRGRYDAEVCPARKAGIMCFIKPTVSAPVARGTLPATTDFEVRMNGRIVNHRRPGARLHRL